MNKKEKKFNIDKTVSHEKLLLILDGILNKVELSNGEIVDFELIDYYKITNLPLRELFIISRKNLKQNQFKVIKDFIERNRNKETANNNKELITMDLSFGDYHLDEAEKEKIFNYLIKNNIPIFVSTFLQVARRYVKGNIKLGVKSTHGNVKNLNIDFTDYRKYDRLNNR